jgi:hypothetical protein
MSDSSVIYVNFIERSSRRYKPRDVDINFMMHKHIVVSYYSKVYKSLMDIQNFR